MTDSIVQRRSRWVGWLATAVLVMLVLAVAVELVVVGREPEAPVAALELVLRRLPLFCYIPALWLVRQTAAELRRGALFEMLAPRLLRGIGVALAAGATAQVFVMPLASRALFGPTRGAFANFDPSAMVLGVVGLLLVLQAPLFARAAAMRAELEEFL
jgi:hypothetical protein